MKQSSTLSSDEVTRNRIIRKYGTNDILRMYLTQRFPKRVMGLPISELEQQHPELLDTYIQGWLDFVNFVLIPQRSQQISTSL